MKYIETDIWCISTNGENFFGDDYSSREEAIEAVKEDYGAGYVGRCVRIKFDERDITYDETGYYLRQALYYEVDETAYDWEMTDEQEIELSKILAKDVIKYINEHNLQPNCYKVVDIEEVKAGGIYNDID